MALLLRQNQDRMDVPFYSDVDDNSSSSTQFYSNSKKSSGVQLRLSAVKKQKEAPVVQKVANVFGDDSSEDEEDVDQKKSNRRHYAKESMVSSSHPPSHSSNTVGPPPTRKRKSRFDQDGPPAVPMILRPPRPLRPALLPATVAAPPPRTILPPPRPTTILPPRSSTSFAVMSPQTRIVAYPSLVPPSAALHVRPAGFGNIAPSGSVSHAPAAAVAAAALPITDEALNIYAKQVYGTTDIDVAKRKQLKRQLELKRVEASLRGPYSLPLPPNARTAGSEPSGKHEYDSDEECADGTWEHKRRKAEMERSQALSNDPAFHARMNSFLNQQQPVRSASTAVASSSQPAATADGSSGNYAANKLEGSNKGFKLLQRMGWKEGTGLGRKESGIVAPISHGAVPTDKQGIGSGQSYDDEGTPQADDEYDSYRKRMMLQYKHRPNPLNNPRRPYY